MSTMVVCQTEETTWVCEASGPSRSAHTVSGHARSSEYAGTSSTAALVRDSIAAANGHNHRAYAPQDGSNSACTALIQGLPSILKLKAGPRGGSRRRSQSEATPERTTGARDSTKGGPIPADCSHHMSRHVHHTRISSLLSPPKIAPAVLHTAQDELELIGSFAPTSPSRQSLRSLLASAPGSPAIGHSSRRLSDADIYDASEHSSRSALPRLSVAIPSICRTPSSCTDSEYFPTAPSSAGPATPAREHSPSPRLKHSPLHPVLEHLEDSSKFRIQAKCASCKKTGSNFPCCPRCGERWCSRECRLQSSGGKRHVCTLRVD